MAPDVFDYWKLSSIEKFALRVSIKACREIDKQKKPDTLTWNWITMFNSQRSSSGPTARALIWSVRMALLQPQHLQTIGKKGHRPLRNSENSILKTKLEAIIQSS